MRETRGRGACSLSFLLPSCLVDGPSPKRRGEDRETAARSVQPATRVTKQGQAEEAGCLSAHLWAFSSRGHWDQGLGSLRAWDSDREGAES